MDHNLGETRINSESWTLSATAPNTSSATMSARWLSLSVIDLTLSA
jgi:hypothetical protein